MSSFGIYKITLLVTIAPVGVMGIHRACDYDVCLMDVQWISTSNSDVIIRVGNTLTFRKIFRFIL